MMTRGDKSQAKTNETNNRAKTALIRGYLRSYKVIFSFLGHKIRRLIFVMKYKLLNPSTTADTVPMGFKLENFMLRGAIRIFKFSCRLYRSI